MTRRLEDDRTTRFYWPDNPRASGIIARRQEYGLMRVLVAGSRGLWTGIRSRSLTRRSRSQPSRRTDDRDLTYLSVRRPLLEWVLREACLAKRGVRVVQSARVTGLIGESRRPPRVFAVAPNTDVRTQSLRPAQPGVQSRKRTADRPDRRRSAARRGSEQSGSKARQSGTAAQALVFLPPPGKEPHDRWTPLSEGAQLPGERSG
jgi:hypothetical protein